MTKQKETTQPENTAKVSGSALSNLVMCCICGDEIAGDGLGEGECCEDCLNYDDLEGLLEAAL